MNPPSLTIEFPTGWLVFSRAGDSDIDDLPPEMQAHLADISSRHPNAVVIAWFAVPLGDEHDEPVGAIVASAFGIWVEGTLLVPGPMQHPLDDCPGVNRWEAEQSIDVAGYDRTWLQVSYSFTELMPESTFMLVFATPNLLLREELVAHFDGIARRVAVDLPAIAAP